VTLALVQERGNGSQCHLDQHRNLCRRGGLRRHLMRGFANTTPSARGAYTMAVTSLHLTNNDSAHTHTSSKIQNIERAREASIWCLRGHRSSFRPYESISLTNNAFGLLYHYQPSTNRPINSWDNATMVIRNLGVGIETKT
jgi:hypothetical protein